MLYGGAILLGLPWAFSVVMTGTMRRAADEPLPAAWREVALRSPDGLALRAAIRAGDPARPAFVIAHGLGDTLDSFLPLGDAFAARGHTVLAVDLRGHGGSEGRLTTLGGLEQRDVTAAMEHLRQQGLAGGGLVLFGFSMGAVAVLHAAADQPDVKAVVAECPYDTYRDTIARHAKLFYGLPRWLPLIPMAIRIAEWRAGFDADAIDSLSAARRLRAPLFLIVDGLDRRMPESIVRRVLDAHPGPKELWVADGVDHVGAQWHPEYPARVAAFLVASGVWPAP
jgi:pimeloyl-ACP methyl ester carboxylesterase